jgi:hypothetical protein
MRHSFLGSSSSASADSILGRQAIGTMLTKPAHRDAAAVLPTVDSISAGAAPAAAAAALAALQGAPLLTPTASTLGAQEHAASVLTAVATAGSSAAAAALAELEGAPVLTPAASTPGAQDGMEVSADPSLTSLTSL